MSNSDFKDEKTNPGIEIKKTEGTRVDLGDDLLSESDIGNETVSEQGSTATSVAPASIEEELANVEILINEQIYDEGKKTLYRILRKQPTHSKAKSLLEQILQLEIQELLTTEKASLKRYDNNPNDPDGISKVLDSLEQDLRLGLQKTELKPVPDLFKDVTVESQYVKSVTDKTPQLNPKDIMDLGIAHLEMGLYKVSSELFEELTKYDDFRVSGIYLLGLSLILGDQCVEATIKLEPLVRDLTLTPEQKCDFLYLMGMAFEKLKETIKAKEFYRRVLAINPRYRDVMEKLR